MQSRNISFICNMKLRFRFPLPLSHIHIYSEKKEPCFISGLQQLIFDDDTFPSTIGTHTVAYGQNKVRQACKREIKGTQNKPQICELQRTVIFWIYPFLERKRDKKSKSAGQKKKPKTMKPALNFILLLYTKNARTHAQLLIFIKLIVYQSHIMSYTHKYIHIHKTFIAKNCRPNQTHTIYTIQRKMY